MSGKLKEVKTRIESVKNTQKITKAMKLVAASKFKKATDAIVQMRPYSTKLLEMLRNIVTATEGDIKIALAEERPEINNVLVVLMTSDKGLCGGFNANLAKAAKRTIASAREAYPSANIELMNIGKKGNDALKREQGISFMLEHIDLFKGLTFDNALVTVDQILAAYEAGTYDRVYMIYSKFVNAISQDFNSVQFLPIEKIDAEADTTKNPESEGKSLASVDYIFEPEKNRLIQELAPKILKTQFYSYLLDTNASEHGARMTAMDSATENAEDLLRELKITYNKERQASITKELIEIVSGASALNG